MKITTSRFGDVEILRESIIAFPDGIHGFPEAKRFVFLNPSQRDMLRWLQSVEISELAFIVCDVFTLIPEYRLHIGSDETKTLCLTQNKDAHVYIILTIPSDPKETTVDLLGPIVINLQKKIGIQTINLEQPLNTSQKIFA